MRTLPAEFWNHELLEADFQQSEAALKSFIDRWGMPYHPMRNSPFFTLEKAEQTGIIETDENGKAFIPMPKRGQIDGNGVFAPDKGSPFIQYISKKEAFSALSGLQLFIANAVYGVGEFSDHEAYETINHAACNPLKLREEGDEFGFYLNNNGISLQSKGLLTSALCNQIIASFADDAEWRICGCEGCGRVFRRKRPDKDGTQPDRDSKYCCTRCRNRQAKRNQRVAAKARIQL